jgi:hypothetical protein
LEEIEQIKNLMRTELEQLKNGYIPTKTRVENDSTRSLEKNVENRKFGERFPNGVFAKVFKEIGVYGDIMYLEIPSRE